MKNFLPLPPDWSQDGHQIDSLIGWVHWLMLALFVGWGLYFLYVLFRFRKSANPSATYDDAKGKTSKYLEVGVVVVEAILLIGFSIPMWATRIDNQPSEAESTVVRVVAEQFAWNFHYPGADGVFGRTDIYQIDAAANPLGLDHDDPAAADDITTINNLYLPVDKPVIVKLTTKDVIHGFYLPVMRVKHDAIPGQEISLSFVPVQTGKSEIGCAQLCGLAHYRMRGFLHIQTQADFEASMIEQAAE
jgi:cytochrome c oxidase subunit 2